MGILAGLIILAFASSTAAATGPASGMVVDASGAPVANATIQITSAGGASATSGADGRFTLETAGAAADASVRITAPGFAAQTVRLPPDDAPIRVVLQPAPLDESITVTASRGAEGLSSPSSTSVVTSAELLNSAAGAVDDALRNTPGFSLFRRSSSRVANPTTQGVTLRGVSGSGASRTVVLADGQPLNDPFGSWVYWNRIPETAIDLVEVVRGASGDLYGADALGGVIQLLTFDSGRPRLRGAFDGGSHDTWRGSFFGGDRVGNWTFSGSGEKLGTDGAYVVSEGDRGSVDVRADSDYQSGFATAGYARGTTRVLVRANGFKEDRGNGTPLQINDTSWRQFSGEASGQVGGGVWSVRGFGGSQTYFQTFTSIAADRNSERLTNDQHIPSDFGGASAQWAGGLGRHGLLVGAEAHRTTSTIDERRYTTTGALQTETFTPADETIASLFARLNLALRDDLTVVVGARGDRWDSTRTIWFLSPHASASWRLNSTVAIQGAVSHAARTPTLNERYRGFRAGAIVTNPNPALEPEHLTSVEGGALVGHGRATARVVAFHSLLSDAIANITVGTNLRERQNSDHVRVSGMEVETDIRPTPALTLTGFAVLTSSHYHDTPKQPAIDGNRVPQVPRYQFGAAVTWIDATIGTLTAQMRATGDQFEDDLNTLVLRKYTVVDASGSRSLTRGLQVFAGVENIFDVEYDTGRTPLRTIGWPRTFHAGVRLFLP